MATTETKTFYPKECEDYKVSDSNIGTPENPVGKGSNNTTYASLYAYWDTSYAYWPFDASVIPEDAVIDSVECTAKAKINSTKYVNASLQLFSGDTAKGSAKNFASTTEKVYSLTTGTWTRAELDSIRLKTEVDSTKANSRILYFYGADLPVTYTYNSEKFMLKLGGAWHDVARVFKKVNGIWVEQTELANVIEDGVRYQNGGEYVAPV